MTSRLAVRGPSTGREGSERELGAGARRPYRRCERVVVGLWRIAGMRRRRCQEQFVRQGVCAFSHHKLEFGSRGMLKEVVGL